ncbi:transglycosylase SLT domain-containing protein [Nocardia sp. NBC_00565]|uniref:transglycosylase SLT domain-containing protein n=1 Tax=Nocardia sp. NBC_00565 TaxID=2975993 RepID=UPI002E8040C3|nr:transglycosylase SLT domain-containing protein [Nocardia sp. NBC_00565]WUC07025.1 transglycosylase SLT domain-containing protein [Nocardia sp. NBC_00565]
MSVDTSLPSRPDAPILNAYAGHIEVALAKLAKPVGTGSAESITVAGLDGLGESQLKSGDIVTKYHAKQSDATKYRDELNSLDTKIVGMAGMAQKSADLANTVYTEVKNLVDFVKGVLDPQIGVPLNPTVELQMNAIVGIDKEVGDAATTVSEAYDEMNEQAGGVNDAASSNNYSPSGVGSYPVSSGGGGGGGSYSGSKSPYTDPVTATTGGGDGRRLSDDELRQYIGKALDALGITDPAARAKWTEGYMTLIKRESGGNTDSINNWDSNAAAGHASQGLTQTIPGTFSSYHVAGTSSNITDPTANIAASMNYVMHRYDVAQDGSNLTSNVQQADARRSPKGY